jgi:hypothetical protein
MKIGDVISDQAGRGLPGIIKSPTFDYSEAPWEIEPAVALVEEIGKAPMFGDVSFSYTVLHEEQPSLDESYNFNGAIFRRIGFSKKEIGARAQADEKARPVINNTDNPEDGEP